MARSPLAHPSPDPPEPSGPYWRDFSLWCPTPLQRIYRWLHLSDGEYDFGARRIWALIGVTWLPLLLLSAFARRAYAGATVPLLMDVDLHVRYLIALPALIAGEVLAHRYMPSTVRQFVECGIVAGPARTGFEQAADRALRLSRSVVVELLLLMLVAIGIRTTPSIASLSHSTWYAETANGPMVMTPAGWWYLLVSRPLFQFVLLRWYFRFLVWDQFVWQVSRLRLRLMAGHPDRRGGLGFLFGLEVAFAPFLFAHGALVTGSVVNGVIYRGVPLGSYQVVLVAIPLLALLFVLVPDFVLAPALWRAKRKGLREYGVFAQRYVREFDHKWLRRPGNSAGPLLGTGDIQSLADLGSSFDVVQGMRVLPSRSTLLGLVFFAVLPLAPLPLTVISGRELLARLVKIVL